MHRHDVRSFSKYLFSKYLLSTVSDLTHVLNVIGFLFQKIILAGTEQTLVGLALKEKDKLRWCYMHGLDQGQSREMWSDIGSFKK